MPPTQPAASTLYALLIGVDCYLPNALPGGLWYPSLNGSVRDIHLVEAYLRRNLSLDDDHLLLLTASYTGPRPPRPEAVYNPPEPPEAWPTYENMVHAFQKLTNLANPGDQVYIHYSGHGGRAVTVYPDLKGPDGLDEALVPLDIGSSSARYLRDIELAYLLHAMVEKGLWVTIVLDSCHSGSGTRGVGRARPRGIPGIDRTPRPAESLVAPGFELQSTSRVHAGAATRAAKPASGWLTEPQGYTLLAACRANEAAWEDCFTGVETNGALTYWLLDALRAAGPETTYRMLHSRILARVHSRIEIQTPMLEGEGDRLVFGSATRKTHFAITVLNVFPPRHQVSLNAGEVHGVQPGDLLAIYPPQATDLSDPQTRQALVEVTPPVFEADCTAALLDPYQTTPIEPGAQAVLIGHSNPLLQRSVGLALDDPALILALQSAISAHGAGFLHLAGPGESLDFQVAVVISGSTRIPVFEIWDRKGDALPNLRPPIRVDEPAAVEHVARRLVHLAKYRNIQALDNPNPGLARQMWAELAGSQPDPSNGGVASFSPGERITLRVHNRLQVNPADPNDPSRILNITVLDLQPDWGVTQIFPASAAAFDTVQPGQYLEIRLEAFLPPGYTETTDILKVFASQRTTNFRWLELPSLDQPMLPRRVARHAQLDPLEQLLAALTADQSLPTAEMKSRSIRVLTDTAADKPWAITQVELRVTMRNS